MKDVLKLSGAVQNKRTYNGIVFNMLDDYNPYYSAPETGRAKWKLEENICPVCARKFAIYRKALNRYAYKQFVGKKYRYFCSWTCLQKFRNKKEVK